MTTVILVEDNRDMRTLLRDLVEWGGHQVVAGRDGDDALKILAAADTPPDVIIADLNMPVMDGLTLLRRVRQNPAWSRIRFVVMSASPYDERLNGGCVPGLDGVLPKPFSLEELHRVLE